MTPVFSAVGQAHGVLPLASWDWQSFTFSAVYCVQHRHLPWLLRPDEHLGLAADEYAALVVERKQALLRGEIDFPGLHPIAAGWLTGLVETCNRGGNLDRSMLEFLEQEVALADLPAEAGPE